MLRTVLARASADEAYSMLALAATLPDDQAQQLRQAAILQIASTDPAAAAREVDFLSSSEERTRLSRRIIADYAAADPYAALEWARGQEPPIQGVEEAVLTTIGIDNPMLAIELMLESERSVSRSVSISRMVTAIMESGSADIERLLTAVQTLPQSGEAQEVVTNLATSWASENPGAALNWLMREGQKCDGQAQQGQCAMITPQLFRITAERIGAQDPIFAMTYAERVPPLQRTAWVRAIAAGYAREDPRAALAWVGGLGSDPDYGPAAVAVIESLAVIDVQAAASLLGTVPRDEAYPGAVQRIATVWAGTDPWAAANWVTQLDDASARGPALNNVIRSWSEQDLAGASGWLPTYPQGSERDALIDIVIGFGVRDGYLDGNLLRAMSTDEAREATAANAVQMAAMAGDVVRARRWMDQYVESRSTREWLERTIEQYE